MASVILPCWIHDDTTYNRHYDWLCYMDTYIRPRLDYDRIILFDNASDLEYLKKLNATIHDEDNNCLAIGRSDLFVYRYHTHIPRTGVLEYPYWWRWITTIPKLKGTFYQADKYYHIDSDNYIQTQEMLDYMKNSNNGFTAFWEGVHNFPTSELFILNKDSVDLLKQYEGKNLNGQCAENVLCFSHVEKKFYGGRLAERGTPGDTAHWVGQVTQGYPVKFRG